jgi:V8-like Glu-specific endopeptidase
MGSSVPRFAQALGGLVALVVSACQGEEVGTIGKTSQPAAFADNAPWFKVKPVNDQAPWHMIAAIYRKDQPLAMEHGCTCFKALNEYSCVTAAHCFLRCDVKTKTPFFVPAGDFIRFGAGAPGQRNEIAPGTYGVAIPKEFKQACKTLNLPNWFAFDYAVVRFKGKFDHQRNPHTVHFGNDDPAVPLGDYPKDFFLISPVDRQVFKQQLEIPGFPDPEHLPQLADFPTMMNSSDGRGASNVSFPGVVFYFNRTESGMSGSPLLIPSPDFRNQWAIGVHSGHHTPFQKNRGVLIRLNVLRWMNEVRGYGPPLPP